MSSMRDDEQVRGRCYGGTAILWKKDLNAIMTPIQTLSPRLSVVKCLIGSRQIISMSVYLSDNIRCNDDECNEVLSEIVSIYTQYDGHNVIIGRDFNCDLN